MFDEPTAGMSGRRGAGRSRSHPHGSRRASDIDDPARRTQDGCCARASRTASSFCIKGRLVADGEPDGGHRLAHRSGSLSRHGRRRNPRRRDALPSTRPSRASTPISAQYHILQGVDSQRAGRRIDGAARPQRRGQDDDVCARSWACGSRRRGDDPLPQANASSAGWIRPISPRRGIAYVPESMGIFSDLTREARISFWPPAVGRNEADLNRARLNWIFDFFPGAAEILRFTRPASCCRVGRSRCSSIARAICRAAQALAHRRADQGASRPPIIEKHDRRVPPAEGGQARPSCLSSRISCFAARRSAMVSPSWMTGASSTRGAHGRSRRPTRRCSTRLLGLSLEAHQ